MEAEDGRGGAPPTLARLRKLPGWLSGSTVPDAARLRWCCDRWGQAGGWVRGWRETHRNKCVPHWFQDVSVRVRHDYSGLWPTGLRAVAGDESA